MDDTILSTAEAAKRLGLKVQTLRAWRLRGHGPTFIRLSRTKAGYRPSTLDAWLAAREFQSTSQETVARGRAA